MHVCYLKQEKTYIVPYYIRFYLNKVLRRYPDIEVQKHQIQNTSGFKILFLDLKKEKVVYIDVIQYCQHQAQQSRQLLNASSKIRQRKTVAQVRTKWRLTDMEFTLNYFSSVLFKVNLITKTLIQQTRWLTSFDRPSQGCLRRLLNAFT